MNEDIKQLEAAWIKAKAEEDKAKQARLLLEDMILEKIGWTEGDPNFKTWKDDIKITFGRKEEYDNGALIEFFKERPQNLLDDGCPFRIKIEPDAKKMIDFKIMHNAFYMEHFSKLCKIKHSKPSFSIVDKGANVD